MNTILLRKSSVSYGLADPKAINRKLSSQLPDPKPAKRPSPYRLLTPTTFISEFAPLHVSGWRLDHIPHRGQKRSEDRPSDQNPDLQDRRLIRLYEFEGSRKGWSELTRFMNRISENVEEEDHHPSIHICPTEDYHSPSTSLSPTDDNRGYLLEISTHTHTPIPAVKSEGKGIMRPGVTGKDLRLAEKVEESWREIIGNVMI